MILHLEDLESGASKGGRIWLTVGETCFPEEGWYDLPGVLLEHWTPALESFANGHSDLCKLTFMDGPYHATLQRQQDAILVKCVEQGRIVLEQRIDFPGFWASVQKCVRTYKRTKYLENK